MLKFTTLLLMLTLLLTGCQSKKKIRIGLNPWPGYEFLYLAKHLKMFEKEGLDVKVIDLASLLDVRSAMEREQIDIMATTTIEVVTSREFSPIKPIIFHVADYSSGSDMVLGFNGLKSLNEKRKVRIGLEPSTLDVYTVQLALENEGLTFDSVTIVPMSQLELIKMVKTKKIDAAATYPPFSIEALKLDSTLNLFNSGMAPGLIVDVLSASSTFLKNNRDEIKIIRKVFDAAIGYYYKNPKEAIKIMAKHEGISENDFIEGLSGLKILRSKDQKKYFENGKLQTIIDKVDVAFRSQGILKESKCLDCYLNPNIEAENP